MSLSELMAALPENARQHVDVASPLPMRMMASKGMAPLPPAQMVIAVCALSYDNDEKIAASAKQTLGKLPPKILGIALDGDLPPAALATLGLELLGRPDLLGKLVLNKGTPDATIAEIAAAAPPEVAEMIAGNQERLLRSEAIVRAIAKNRSVLKSSLDRLFDFLVRSGVILADMPQFAEALTRLSSDDRGRSRQRPVAERCLRVAGRNGRRSEQGHRSRESARERAGRRERPRAHSDSEADQ
jgi:hypothetical protein